MRLRGLAVLVLVLLVSCEAPPRSAAPDPRSVVDSALSALAAAPAVAYRLSGATLTVTKGGLAEGELPLESEPVRALRVGGSLYVRASPAYWQRQGMSATRAARFGAQWTRADRGMPFDPGRLLAPQVVAAALRAALPRGALPVQAGGAFDLAGLRVSTTPPYRVLGFPPTFLGPVAGQLGPHEIALGDVRLPDLRDRLDEQLADLGQPLIAGPVVAAQVTDHDLRCAANGACTDTVRVDNRLLGAAPSAAARVNLTSTVTSDTLGARTCEREVVLPLDTAADVSCSVRFTLPRADGATRLQAAPSVTAEPVAVVDPGALKRDVAAELGP
ncbi:hypothetical protein GCM10017786_37140 [Amycolatopsis deserti]|uniref:Lipoprotein n=1 Tax=Amycolatopsis deserti TaxID=185696 RepID=A0ABQ3J4A1_9PSEU|nr:hypothetical protein [Amycolatopsis deserti]GHF00840.1 hypothetical protein GCM10017786_37140 [Amycolatopsis deserti]